MVINFAKKIKNKNFLHQSIPILMWVTGQSIDLLYTSFQSHLKNYCTPLEPDIKLVNNMRQMCEARGKWDSWRNRDNSDWVSTEHWWQLCWPELKFSINTKTHFYTAFKPAEGCILKHVQNLIKTRLQMLKWTSMRWRWGDKRTRRPTSVLALSG